MLVKKITNLHTSFVMALAILLSLNGNLMSQSAENANANNSEKNATLILQRTTPTLSTAKSTDKKEKQKLKLDKKSAREEKYRAWLKSKDEAKAERKKAKNNTTTATKSTLANATRKVKDDSARPNQTRKNFKATSTKKSTQAVSKINTANPSKNTPEYIYKKHGYKAAIQEFKKKKNLTTEDKVKIANSYRLNHEVEDAAEWYEQVVAESDDPIHKLHYAQVLQSTGDKVNSAKYFNAYNESISNGDQWAHLSEVFAENISNEERFKENQVELRNEKHINTNKLEYSPAFYKNGITYVSTKKPDKIPAVGIDPWIDENFMALYYAQRSDSDGLVAQPEAFSYDITTKFHEGPVSFSKNGEQIFFTRNHYLKGKRTNSSKGIMRLQIYTSEKTKDGWSNPVELPFNTKEYEECHPSVTSDGQTIYFASDRPGGHGGMDIYKSEYSEGNWSEPTNLGPTINTAGNEIFPFIHQSGILFFASNGKDGLGGLDIFQSKALSGEWSEATNVGKPFNSIKDDFGFILNEDATYGYLSSARNGGFGKDDIYSFALDPAILSSRKAKICTFLQSDGTRISDAELIIKEHRDQCDQEKHLECKLSQFTGQEGTFETTIDSDKNYHITAKKDGYETTVYTVSGKEILESENSEYCIPLTKTTLPECISLETTVVNITTNIPVAYATLKLQNKCDGSIVEYLSDDKGHLDFGCIPCNCEYELIGSKPRIGEGTEEISTTNITCTKENRISKIIRLGNTGSSKDPEFKSGDVIVLDNIYYDFNKYEIRSDARPELDKVVTLMKKYPAMIIELGSHTDARASKRYNDKLSTKRAEAAVEYIIKKGIDNRRIIAKGYGENIPRNECIDYVNCSEEKHQYNRRTEIKVIQFNKESTEVQYENKGPQKIDKADPNRRWIWK